MKNFVIICLALMPFISCQGIMQPEENSEKAVVFRDGSLEHPFVPEDFIPGGEILDSYLDKGSEVWVEGYVVGYVAGTKITAVVLNADAGCKASNVVICGSDDGVGQLMPVQLSTSPEESKAVRDQLNLSENPEMLGCRVIIRGQPASYMGTVGLKSTTSAIF